MTLNPIPGRSLGDIVLALDTIYASLLDTRSGRAADRIQAFHAWAAEAARQLRYLLPAHEVEGLIFTASYHRLLTVPAGSPDRALNALLETETENRLTELEAYRLEFKGLGQRWSSGGELVVFDTNVYLEQPRKVLIPDIDVLSLLGLSRGPIRLLIPMLVIDELDRLKRDPRAGDKARKTLRALEVILGDGLSGRIEPSDRPRRPDVTFAGVTAEIVLDPQGHRRLGIADDEIVERALRVRTLAGRPVRLVTFDTGMAVRARAAGLQVQKLEYDPALGRKPEPGLPAALPTEFATHVRG